MAFTSCKKDKGQNSSNDSLVGTTWIGGNVRGEQVELNFVNETAVIVNGPTYTFSATYTRDGNTITIAFPDGSLMVGEINGKTIISTSDGVTMVFAKQ